MSGHIDRSRLRHKVEQSGTPLRTRPGSTAVNRVGTSGPALLEPVALAEAIAFDLPLG
jgi:hypothetical protein